VSWYCWSQLPDESINFHVIVLHHPPHTHMHVHVHVRAGISAETRPQILRRAWACDVMLVIINCASSMNICAHPFDLALLWHHHSLKYDDCITPRTFFAPCIRRAIIQSCSTPRASTRLLQMIMKVPLSSPFLPNVFCTVLAKAVDRSFLPLLLRFSPSAIFQARGMQCSHMPPFGQTETRCTVRSLTPCGPPICKHTLPHYG
jgi:hypothetical protein